MSVLKPKFVFFDLDDTLLDHKHAERQALTDTYFAFIELQQAALDDWIDTYHHINEGLWEQYNTGEIDRQMLQRQRFEKSLLELDVDATQSQEIGKQYMEFYARHWKWIDGAEVAFESIRDHYEVGIITNGFSETQDKKFKRFDLYDRAKVTVISEDVGYMKPHPKVFTHAAEKAGYQSEEILYVGDSFSSDIKGGHNAGWKTAWYLRPNGQAIEETDPADMAFNDFNELTERLLSNA
jgi:YjjG family noncanonical pyrimidine nucleotidase